MGTAIAYMSPHQQERWAVFLGLRLSQGGGHVLRVVAIRHRAGMPPICFKPLADIFSERKIRCASQRDVVLIIKIDELAQAKVSRERSCFRSHPFHQIAIRDKRISVVIDQIMTRAVISSRQPCLGDGHAHAVAETLPERTGRNLDARRMPRSGWPGVWLPHWRKRLISSSGQIIACKMQQAV